MHDQTAMRGQLRDHGALRNPNPLVKASIAPVAIPPSGGGSPYRWTGGACRARRMVSFGTTPAATSSGNADSTVPPRSPIMTR
jgi:hypothetical protein